MLIHLDTDIGGDPDDACALLMLLGSGDVELAGLTTNSDDGGERAGMAAAYLALAGRDDVPIAAGAERSLTTGRRFAASRRREYWDALPPARPARPGEALDMIAASIGRGATVVAIGALTNLAQLELRRPGALAAARVVAMGGYLDPPAAGLPRLRPGDDWNVQCDTRAAEVVLAAAGDLVLAPLPVCAAGHLRERDLPRIAAASPLGALVARQCRAWAALEGMAERGRAHPGLPDDLVNFQWDPLTAALAAGFAPMRVERTGLALAMDGETLLMARSAAGRPATVLRSFDAAAFGEHFLASAARAARRR